MLYNPARRASSLDPALLWSAVLLAAIGLVMVYSASIAMAEAERFTGFRPGYFLVRHSAYLAVGLAIAAALFRAPVWLWQKASPWLFLFGTLLLVAVPNWKGFTLHYRYRGTLYHINVLQVSAGSGETSVTVDGVEQHDTAIPLVDDHQEHSVEVKIQAASS